MNTDKYTARLISRRNFLKAAVVVGTTTVGGLGAIQMLGGRNVVARLAGSVKPIKEQHVGFTDGWVSMPDQAEPLPPFWPDPGAPAHRNGYVFGIRHLMAPSGDRTNKWQPMSAANMF